VCRERALKSAGERNTHGAGGGGSVRAGPSGNRLHGARGKAAHGVHLVLGLDLESIGLRSPKQIGLPLGLGLGLLWVQIKSDSPLDSGSWVQSKSDSSLDSDSWVQIKSDSSLDSDSWVQIKSDSSLDSGRTPKSTPLKTDSYLDSGSVRCLGTGAGLWELHDQQSVAIWRRGLSPAGKLMAVRWPSGFAARAQLACAHAVLAGHNPNIIYYITLQITAGGGKFAYNVYVVQQREPARPPGRGPGSGVGLALTPQAQRLSPPTNLPCQIARCQLPLAVRCGRSFPVRLYLYRRDPGGRSDAGRALLLVLVLAAI
jgi:hypothetical protein